MKKVKNHFNLVEIILAMGIILVCITTIMGMFSYGLKVSNDAVMQNYMTNVLEQVGGMVETHPAGEKVPTLTAAPYDETGSPLNSSQIETKESNCTTIIDSSDPFLSNVYYDGNIMDTIKIEFKTDIEGTEAIDFTAYARLYISATAKTVNTSDGTTVTLNNDVLSVQVTWPASKPYGDRVLEGNVLEYTKVMRP